MRTVRLFGSGAAAGCAFVIVALIARAADAVPTLPELIQDRLVLALPGPLFSLLLDHFLYLGKPLLFGSLLFGQVLLGGLAGILIGRVGRPVVIAALLWLATGLVLLPLAVRGAFAGSISVALVTLLGFVAYVVVFVLFSERAAARRDRLAHAWKAAPARASAAAVGTTPRRLDRRRLLAGSALGLTAIVLTRRAIGRLPSLPPRGASASGGTAQASGALDADPSGTLPGLPPPVTPADRFYIVSKNLLDPDLGAGSWRLRVTGLVAHPLSLRYADLLALPAAQEYRTLECVSNEVGGDLISNGLWTGVRLADLLQRAGVLANAAAIQFTSADGYTAGMPIAQALDASTLLAYQLDDSSLPHKHGYPLRVLGIGTYGMKNPKWLTRVDVTGAEMNGFWQKQGWDAQDIVQTMSQITAPRDGARLPAGSVRVVGVAFAGARGIAQVEVSANGGATWEAARLLPPLGPYAWTFWEFDWLPVAGGAYPLSVRATDGTGTLQPQRRTDPFPAGATGYHEIHVRAAGT